MHTTPASQETRRQLLACLRNPNPGEAASGPDTGALDSALRAYGDLDAHEICKLALEYATAHDDELQQLLRRHASDARRPALLSDPALPCVLERLEHDRYALRRAWEQSGDPRELQRVADLWGIRLALP
jgi:hypothetical protein